MTAPQTDVMTEEFHAALARGELLIQQCQACQQLTLYPKYACPHCQSEELGWTKAAGAGLLHSHTVSRIGAPQGFESDLPYALAVVKLDEGVQLLGRLVPDDDGDWSGYSCDDRVELVTDHDDDRPIAWFRRAGSVA